MTKANQTRKYFPTRSSNLLVGKADEIKTLKKYG
jgi:hypothetical protein